MAVRRRKRACEGRGASELNEGLPAANQREKRTRTDPRQQQQTMMQLPIRWISRLAILGGSPTALAISFCLFLLASFLFLSIATSNPLGPVPTMDPPRIFHLTNTTTVTPQTQHYTLTHEPPVIKLTNEMREEFLKDGVIAVRGLLSEQLLRELDQEADIFVEDQFIKNRRNPKRGTQFFTQKIGIALRGARDIDTDLATSQTIQNMSGFTKVALFSEVPSMAAQLLFSEVNQDSTGNTTDTTAQTVRMLRDIFLSKDNDPYFCGWHVDDFAFWPATPASNGVNAWISLDDVPLDGSGGGGFALAIGSHVAPWKEQAHYVTGSSWYFPPKGYHNATDLIERRTGKGTCNLKTAAPILHERMEATKREYAIQRGDVIFHTRWLYHRTVPMSNANNNTHATHGKVYRRYSIRYAPGSAVIPPGYGTEPSVLWDEPNGGRTTDEVSEMDGPWYPRVWPSVSLDELLGLADIGEKMDIAEKQQAERQKVIKQLLHNQAKRQFKHAL
jgi:hypothetical protein